MFCSLDSLRGSNEFLIDLRQTAGVVKENPTEVVLLFEMSGQDNQLSVGLRFGDGDIVDNHVELLLVFRRRQATDIFIVVEFTENDS